MLAAGRKSEVPSVEDTIDMTKWTTQKHRPQWRWQHQKSLGLLSVPGTTSHAFEELVPQVRGRSRFR